MTPELFEILLHQNESETLDFKSGQYAFENASPGQTSELLKDILAFANAWRQTDAYILVGVIEKRDARSVVSGIKDHLINRNLQQFVVSKTNRPVFFSYASFKYEDKQIGILHIPVQDRPVFLIKDFGRLRSNVVYIRRGDTTGEASPDEVLRMGAASGIVFKDQPTLDLHYGDPMTRRRWSDTPELSVTSFSVPPASRLPDYGVVGQSGLYVPNISGKNRHFYRHAAEYFQDHFIVKPVAIAVDNTATANAQEVFVKITINRTGVIVRSPEEMPRKPNPDHFMSILAKKSVASTTSVGIYGECYEINIPVGNVQPGTTVWSADPFFIGARQDVEVTVDVSVSANNMRFPQITETVFKIRCESRSLSIVQIKDLAQSFE